MRVHIESVMSLSYMDERRYCCLSHHIAYSSVTRRCRANIMPGILLDSSCSPLDLNCLTALMFIPLKTAPFFTARVKCACQIKKKNRNPSPAKKKP